MSGRIDGRTAGRSREVAFDLTPLNASDGSARVALDKTVVLASAAGPRGVPSRRDVDSTSAQLDVSWRPDVDPTGSSDARQRAIYALQISGALRAVFLAGLQPRTGLQFTLQVLRDDGGLLAAALNAACGAACDAGMPLSNVIGAACVAIDANGVLIVDPCREEEAVAQCVVTCAFKLPPGAGSAVGMDDGAAGGHEDDESLVLSSITSGSCTVEQFVTAVNACRAVVLKCVAPALRRAVERRHALEMAP